MDKDKSTMIMIIAMLIGAIVVITSCQTQPTKPSLSLPSVSGSSICSYKVIDGLLMPDTECTPGGVLTTDIKEICVVGYSATVRNVSESLKRKVYNNYGVVNRTPYSYQIDHLVALQLGGNNDIKNLWPLPTDFKKKNKDVVENCLQELVCTGELSLREAQEGIAENWIQYLDMCGVD